MWLLLIKGVTHRLYYISRVQSPRNIVASKAAAEQGASYPQIYLQIKDN